MTKKVQHQKKSTNYELLRCVLDKLGTLDTRLSSRIGGVNKRVDSVNKRVDDLHTSISTLQTEVTTQFTNHLSVHETFEKRIKKWGIVLLVMIGVGVVINKLELIIPFLARVIAGGI